MHDRVKTTCIVNRLFHPDNTLLHYRCLLCFPSLLLGLRTRWKDEYETKYRTRKKSRALCSNDQISKTLTEDETPRSCIKMVNISGSDSSGTKCFSYSIFRRCQYTFEYRIPGIDVLMSRSGAVDYYVIQSPFCIQMRGSYRPYPSYPSTNSMKHL